MFFVPSPEVLVCLSSLIKPKAQQKTDLFYNKYMYKKQYKIGSYDKKKACIQIHKVLAHIANFSPKQTKAALHCIVVNEKTTGTTWLYFQSSSTKFSL